MPWQQGRDCWSWPAPSHACHLLHPKIGSSGTTASRQDCRGTAGLSGHPQGLHGGCFRSFFKRPKPEIFLRDGRAGWEGASRSVSQYHEERAICSLHAEHGLTLSIIRIFIRFAPSCRSRWLVNACLSLSPPKLHCIIVLGKCNGHYKRHSSSLLPPHPAPLLLKGRTVRHDSFPPSSAPTHQLQQRPPCIFPLLTPLEKPPTFPNQTLSFASQLGKAKEQRSCI